MTNQERRQIITEAKAKGYTGSYVDLFRQAAQNPEMLVAETPEQKQAGLRPLHEAGRTDASMAFKDVPPNTPFNTVGMKAPIDIKKYDEQGHLVKSYEDVPPGLTNIDSGPARGTVLETPSRMQEGGFASDNTRVSMPAPPEMYLNEPPPQPMQTFVGPQNPDVGAREREGLEKRFEADQKRREAIEKGVNPNLAFMMPQGLGADSEAKAAYQYDNPATSNIGQIASGIGFLPIDRGLDIALTAAGSAIKKGAEARAFKKFESEIDWGKWNPDTPNHPVLMDEYKQIEFNTKRNGTWMKNPDGSAYKGRPEQFVQEQSSHFKKAFPEGAYHTYRGVGFMAGEHKGLKLDPALGTNKVVFSAGEELAASPYYTKTGTPETWRPGSVRDPNITEGFIAPLYAKESRNSYRIISQGDKWNEMSVAGRSQEELSRLATSNSIAANVERQKMAKMGSGPLRTATESKAIKHEAAARQFKWFADNYHIVNKNPTASPNFEQLLKDNLTSIGKTDDIGEIARLEGLDDVRMFGLNDGDWSPHVNMHINKPGNYLKSRVGNVGFFDMKSDDMFKAMVPLGGAGAAFQASSSGKRDTYKKGGYIKKSKKIKRRRAQQGQAVDYLLGALGQQGDMSAAEIGAQQAQDAAAITSGAERDLAKEEQRVRDVRANVIPTAQHLESLGEEIRQSYWKPEFARDADDPYNAKLHFEKMREAKTPDEYEALEAEAKEKYPNLIEAIPRNNLLVMRPDKYDADDELYCTPYGCYTYKKAGAYDVPEYSGNPGFVAGAKSGRNPFQKISADEAVPGDVGIMYEYEVNDYRDESAGMSLRPHHTTILSEKTDDPQTIRNFSAIDGARLNFREEKLTARDKKDAEGNVHKGRWDFYRYIGQTPQAQRAVVDARNNQAQADLAAQALQQQAELAAQMPEREVDNVSMIDRREAAKIETDDPTADIVTTPKKKKKKKKRSAKEVVENVTNKIAGEVYETKDRKQSIREIRRRYNEKIQEIKSDQ